MQNKFNRRKSRAIAMELLYSETVNARSGEITEEFLDDFISMSETTENLDRTYIRNILNIVEGKEGYLKGVISPFLKDWDINRLSRVNLSILKIAAGELLFLDDIPDRVSLNEALELSKIYSDEDSTSFINGVLDKILKAKAQGTIQSEADANAEIEAAAKAEADAKAEIEAAAKAEADAKAEIEAAAKAEADAKAEIEAATKAEADAKAEIEAAEKAEAEVVPDAVKDLAQVSESEEGITDAMPSDAKDGNTEVEVEVKDEDAKAVVTEVEAEDSTEVITEVVVEDIAIEIPESDLDYNKESIE